MFINFKTIKWRLAIAISLFTTLTQAQTKLIDEINKTIVPIYISSDSITDLEKLRPFLQGKSIVGLGEATHGTHEFFAMKSRLIKFMVEKLGYKTFIMESDFVGTQQMNDYILNGKGNVNSALHAMLSGPAMSQEYIDLIEWLRKYNLSQSLENRVQLWGCDMQFGSSIVEALQKGIIKFKSPISPAMNEGLDLIKNWWGFGKVSKKDATVIATTMQQLLLMQLDEPDARQRMIDQQEIAVLKQSVDYMMQEYIFDKDKVRDKCMAANADWIYQLLSSQKTILWLHNLHIAKNIPTNRNVFPMGYYLKNKFADQYYVIGFGFNSGALLHYSQNKKGMVVDTIPEVTLKNSSDYQFSQANNPTFFLDFKTSSANSELARFLNFKTNARVIGGHYDIKNLADGGYNSTQPLASLYDAIIFFKHTTAASPISFSSN